MLSGQRIKELVQSGEIVISPFSEDNVGPNSVDLTLGDTLLVMREPDRVLDMREPPDMIALRIPPEGLVLAPRTLYLGMTQEIAGARRDHVPCIEGRSSVARLGLAVHITAGFGDVGFVNHWTLEMVCVHPIRIYAGVRICQIFFEPLDKLVSETDPIVYGQLRVADRASKYATSSGLAPTPSRLSWDFK